MAWWHDRQTNMNHELVLCLFHFLQTQYFWSLIIRQSLNIFIIQYIENKDGPFDVLRIVNLYRVATRGIAFNSELSYDPWIYFIYKKNTIRFHNNHNHNHNNPHLNFLGINSRNKGPDFFCLIPLSWEKFLSNCSLRPRTRSWLYFGLGQLQEWQSQQSQ